MLVANKMTKKKKFSKFSAYQSSKIKRKKKSHSKSRNLTFLLVNGRIPPDPDPGGPKDPQHCLHNLLLIANVKVPILGCLKKG